MCSSPHLWFCMQNSDFCIRIKGLYGSQTSPVVLCMKNSVVSTRNTSLHVSQTSPVVLCIQNNVISIRITSLYGSQPSSVALARKTATFGSELHVSMGPRLCQLIWVPAIICGFCMQNSYFRTRITSLYGTQLSPMYFFACITA